MPSLEPTTYFGFEYVHDFLVLPDTGDPASFPPPDPLPDYVTFFDPGVSFARLFALCENCFAYAEDQSAWLAMQPFSLHTDPPGYRRVRVVTSPSAPSADFPSLLQRLAPGETVASARAFFLAAALFDFHNLSRHFTSLCDERMVRCADRSAASHRVYIGRDDIDGYGFEVHDIEDDEQRFPSGLAAMHPT